MGGEKCSALNFMPRRMGSPPHRRGKEAAFSARPPAFPGLPPRRRGKVPLDHRHPLGEGITPAWAGKRQEHWSCRTNPKDHPRVGGEKIKNSRSGTNKEGSPPRGRGKGRLPGHLLNQIGITPAWAGKRAACWCRCTIPEDHPRVGGEKRLIVVMLYAAVGSPPRGRGKAQGRILRDGPSGITPAWAGKS